MGREIQMQSGVHIDIPPACEEGTNHRKVRISGTPEAIQAAQDILTWRVAGERSAAAATTSASATTATIESQPTAPATEKEVKIPGEHVGRIIGRQGSTIRQIQELSAAHVDIERDNLPDGMRLLRIQGTQEAIELC